MATIRAVLPPFGVRQVFPRILSSLTTSVATPLLRLPLYPSSFLPASYSGAAISSTVSSLLADIWDSILRAVPKKKTSHMKKRHRQMAGKALKDAININTCPSCGERKRSHVLCPTCVSEIKQSWREAEKKEKKATA
ncbi:hypothetical protein VTO42DRAFT_5464 [Malbranchea cinnamomea]